MNRVCRVISSAAFAQHALANLSSLALHMALLTGLAIVLVQAERSPPQQGPALVAQLAPRMDAPTEHVLAPEEANVETRASRSGVAGEAVGWGAGGGAPPVATIGSLPSDLSETGSGGVGDDALGGQIGEADLRELTSLRKRDASQASFFGIMAGGEKFAFVVDISGSMRHDLRFNRARAELRRSLEALSSNQQYFVVFFSDGAYPMSPMQLISATQPNIRNTVKWISRLEPISETDPLSSLEMAIGLKPDAIFLLSDGAFSPFVLDYVAGSGTGDRIPIHTIAFSNRDGEPLLREIARITKGTFRFVR